MTELIKISDLLFYGINGHYIFINPNKIEKKIIFSKSFFCEFHDSKVYSHKEIKDYIDIEILPGRYKYFNNQTFCYFERVTLKSAFCKLLNIRTNEANRLLNIEKFRHSQKENLLDELMTPESNIYSIMHSLSDYTFSCHFSLWNYDDQLEFFSCLSSSFVEAGKIITNETSSTLLGSILVKEITIESRGLSENSPLYSELNQLGMKSLNRLIIKYGDSKVAVATFYSKHEDFVFCDRLGVRVSQSIKNKLNELLEGSNERYEKFAKSIRVDLNNISLKTYADSFLDGLCQYFNYYSAGIFLVDESNLFSLSTCGNLNNNSGLLDTVLDKISTKESFIIYNKSQSINIPDDEILQEEPIKSVLVRSFSIGEMKLCFIMTKKFEDINVEAKLPYFYNDDSMERVTDYLIFNLQILIVQTGIRRELEQELEQAKNFMKVWRHEIRSPISKFNLGSDLIKLLVSKAGIEEKLGKKINLQLDEIKLLGNRLKQLTDVYSFDAILEKKNRAKEKVSILQDVVFPIINTSKDYAAKQHDIEFVIEHNSLSGVYLLSDVKLLNMVLNALVDNAMKYSKASSEIVKIYGHRIDEFFAISISNKGTPILVEETSTIFENGKRGVNATSQNIDGTGVGLFIAESVMETLGGRLEITSNTEDNIEFSMLIPNERV